MVPTAQAKGLLEKERARATGVIISNSFTGGWPCTAFKRYVGFGGLCELGK